MVIDQKIGYLGGIDLCYGRYDNENYALSEPLKNATYFPGSDFNNVRIKDFAPARFADKCMIDKRSVPRMPWRDVQVRLEGEAVKDMSRNFVQYWSFIKNDFATQKESRQIGVSNTIETKKQLLRQKSNEEITIGAKKYMPKSSLVPQTTSKNLFGEISLDDDSTMTKHQKNLMAIAEVDETLEARRNTKRIFKSVEHGVRVELEDLINQIKDARNNEDEEDFMEK